MSEYGGLIQDDPGLLAAMSAAVDYVNKRRRNPSHDERVRALEDAQGNAGPRTIPYKAPPTDSYQDLPSDSADRKPELVMATGTRGDPRNKPGKRNNLGKAAGGPGSRIGTWVLKNHRMISRTGKKATCCTIRTYSRRVRRPCTRLAPVPTQPARLM